MVTGWPPSPPASASRQPTPAWSAQAGSQQSLSSIDDMSTTCFAVAIPEHIAGRGATPDPEDVLEVRG